MFRVIDPTDFQAVTPDATNKSRFVVVDCVGVTEEDLSDSRPLERQPTVSFNKLLDAVAWGTTDPDILSSIASRLARLDRQLGKPDQQALTVTAGGVTLHDIAAGIVDALDPDRQIAAARQIEALPADVEPTPQQIDRARNTLLKAAAAPLATNPALRAQIFDVKQRFEQTIDTISADQVLDAAYSEAARQRARDLATSFEEFIRINRDEITALQVLYTPPYRRRLRFADIRALADAIQAPPRRWTGEELWRAYETLERSKVRGSGGRVLTDIVSLVRFALKQESELIPFPDQVHERFAGWLSMQEIAGRRFTDEQRRWLEEIRDHIAGSFRIELEDFDLSPFAQHGGAGRAYQVFGEDLRPILDELNEALVA